VVQARGSGANCWLGIGPDLTGPLPAGTALMPRGTVIVVPGDPGVQVQGGLYRTTWTIAVTGNGAVETLLTRYVNEVPMIIQRRFVCPSPDTTQLSFNIWVQPDTTFDYELILANDLGPNRRIQASINAGRQIL
jgi:hypothetical protein